MTTLLIDRIMPTAFGELTDEIIKNRPTAYGQSAIDRGLFTYALSLYHRHGDDVNEWARVNNAISSRIGYFDSASLTSKNNEFWTLYRELMRDVPEIFGGDPINYMCGRGGDIIQWIAQYMKAQPEALKKLAEITENEVNNEFEELDCEKR